MGYDIAITRSHWTNSDGPPISLEEWTALVSTDPEMRMDGFAETIVGGGNILRVERPGIAVWTAYSGRAAWFRWFDGVISVKNPDDEILRKMLAIAQRLSANLQGDDGEFYDGDGRVIYSPDRRDPQVHEAPHIRKPWWKFW